MKKLLFGLILLGTIFIALFAAGQLSSAQEEKSENGTNNADELNRVKRISLEILNRQLINRNVGTINDLKVEKVEIDNLQMAHTRFQQTVDDIPVWEGEAIVHLNSDGSLFTITDNLKESITVDTKPNLSADDAVRIADSLYEGTAKQSDKPKVKLWIYRGKNRDYLVYRVETPRIDGSRIPAVPVDFIDAQTGERVFGYNNLQTGTGVSLYSGTVTIGTSSFNSQFYMENLTRKIGTFNFNNTTSTGTAVRFNDADDVWNSTAQRAGVDAHYGAEATMNYYQSVHSRNGIDGSGGPGSFTAAANSSLGLISSFVHYSSSYNNAFWDSTGLYMVYGDGDGVQFSPLTTLDICGHELTHGVTQYTANLTYASESGALNESMSDVMGTMVERYAHPSTWNWKIGEDAYTPGTSGDALRVMDNPHSVGDPDHYSLRLYPGACTPSNANDQCGVHTNSSITNHAFYLIAAGGTNRVSGTTVSGIGADNAAKIWYLALKNYMTSSTNFAGARTATLNATTALFGASSTQYNSVATGWCAVGVGSCPVITCSSSTINIGQTINGNLQNGDCLYTDNSYYDAYTFSGTAGQQIAISMNSTQFNAYLFLVQGNYPGGTIVAQDNNGGGGNNARIPATSGFLTLAATGTYTILANSFSAGESGTYSLSLTSNAPDACTQSTPISLGQTINGVLTNSDCLVDSNYYTDKYSFSGTTGQQIVISMNSSAVDTYLLLYTSSGQFLTSDNDGGGGTNSRIPATSGSYTLPSTGSYIIEASTNPAFQTGAYSVSLVPGVVPPSTRRPFDFDGDGKTDIGIFRPSNGQWWINRSSNGSTFATTFGNSADVIAPADYTGDGKTDIAFFRPSNGTWYVLRSEDSSFYAFAFGTNGDIPAPGYFDTDNRADPTVFRPSNTTWYTLRSTDGGFTIQQFGANGDVPVIGNYDGDNRDDIAIWRPSTGVWWISRSSLGVVAYQFGASTDKPVVGDFTGDGKADAVVWRPSNGNWFVLRSENLSFYAAPFGATGDIPLSGDYDGDGRSDFAVFRPSNSTWYVNRSTAGNLTQGFGIAGDKPVPSAFVP